jgi:hypothetical protein
MGHFMLKTTLTIVFLLLLITPAFAQEWRLPDPEFEPGQTRTSAAQGSDESMDSLLSQLRSDNSGTRLKAVKQLDTTAIADTTKVLSALIAAIQSEIDTPISLEKFTSGSSATITEFLKFRYSEALSKLSPFPSAYLRTFVDTAQGEIRQWIIITVLAKQKDETVHHEVKRVAEESQDPSTLLRAFDGLMQYEDTNDVTFFEKALSDNWLVIDTIPDTFLEDGSPAITPVYPIRSAAMRALSKMGYSIGKNEKGYYIYK